MHSLHVGRREQVCAAAFQLFRFLFVGGVTSAGVTPQCISRRIKQECSNKVYEVSLCTFSLDRVLDHQVVDEGGPAQSMVPHTRLHAYERNMMREHI